MKTVFNVQNCSRQAPRVSNRATTLQNERKKKYRRLFFTFGSTEWPAPSSLAAASQVQNDPPGSAATPSQVSGSPKTPYRIKYLLSLSFFFFMLQLEHVWARGRLQPKSRRRHALSVLRYRPFSSTTNSDAPVVERPTLAPRRVHHGSLWSSLDIRFQRILSTYGLRLQILFSFFLHPLQSRFSYISPRYI